MKCVVLVVACDVWECVERTLCQISILSRKSIPSFSFLRYYRSLNQLLSIATAVPLWWVVVGSIRCLLARCWAVPPGWLRRHQHTAWEAPFGIEMGFPSKSWRTTKTSDRWVGNRMHPFPQEKQVSTYFWSRYSLNITRRRSAGSQCFENMREAPTCGRKDARVMERDSLVRIIFCSGSVRIYEGGYWNWSRRS